MATVAGVDAGSPRPGPRGPRSRGRTGGPPGGTSTDAVAIAASGRGAATRFGRPISEAGWVVARAPRTAVSEGVRRWMEHEG